MYIVTATAPGATHVNPGQPGKINNQDAVARVETPAGSVVVLCDGCGSQPYSGTGADIGAHVIAHAVAVELARCRTVDRLGWKSLTKTIQNELRAVVKLFAADSTVAAFELAVVERFLFTTLVVVVDKNGVAVVSSFGDGLVIADEEITIVEPPIRNAPPYLGYLLLKESAYHAEGMRSRLAFSPVVAVDLHTLKSGLIVGTDGLEPLVDEDLHHPALAQPRSLQRWLNAQSTEKLQNGAFVPGRCPDDVSLVIVRTDEAQQRLVESRREIAGLKQELMGFRSRIVSTGEKLKQSCMLRKEGEEKIAALKDDLGQITSRVQQVQQPELLEAELSSCDAEIEGLRVHLPSPPAPWSTFWSTYSWGSSRHEKRRGATGKEQYFSSLIPPPHSVDFPEARFGHAAIERPLKEQVDDAHSNEEVESIEVRGDRTRG
jgi:hypothetical protein